MSARRGRWPLSVLRLSIVLVSATVSTASTASAQGTSTAPRSTILAAARDVIAAARYATFTTLSSDGTQPQARVVDPLAPDGDFVVWIATNPATRKVAELRQHLHTTLLWFDAKALEYVTLVGTAEVVRDRAEIARHWKRDWDPFYPGGSAKGQVVLIRVRPLRIEVVSPSHKVMNDSATWRPASVEMRTAKPR